MNTIEQAREVAERLRNHDTCISDKKAADTIDALLAELSDERMRCAQADNAVAQMAAELAALKSQEPVAWVRFSDGEVDYDADAVISNTEGDCMDEYIEWRPVFLAAGAVVKDSLTTQEPTPLEVRLVDTLLGQAQEPFAPDWAGYRQGKADGIAEAQEHTPWVGLTEVEITEIITYPRTNYWLAVAIEAKLKEKNT